MIGYRGSAVQAVSLHNAYWSDAVERFLLVKSIQKVTIVFVCEMRT
ncbi:hypothetical protein [Paenibacillus qinlingensis]|nr:hypothetical protein [Paenibacillus qinlingensis]NQX58693.1 hypothetical protein [Paenibacillus qinlingensis]